MHGVVQFHAAIDGFEFHFGLAFTKTSDTALCFKLQCIRIGRHDVHQADLARELGSDRTDLERNAHSIDIGLS